MMAAMESFNNQVVIVGGLDKGNSDFLSAIKIHGNKIKLISCYGESGQTIYNNLKSEFKCIYNEEFSKAVIEAFSRCLRGDTLLLSPGCASYDQFNSYIERGNKFKEIIVGLS
jgi:UDP-N-acetylmuramoylalanine--D-glutamate ligase